MISFNLEPVYSLAIVIGAGLVWLFAQKPIWGVYAVAALFPFINLQLFIGEQINIPYVDLVALLVFIGWLLKKIWRAAAS